MSTSSLAEFISHAEELWPPDSAEEWDRVGLTIGNPQAKITNVLLAVDPVHSTVDEALSLNAELLFTHHPLLLRGISTVAEDTAKGAIVTHLIQHRCALYTAHTNADKPASGVSATLAKVFGLQNVEAILGDTNNSAEFGIGRVGDLDKQITLEEFAELVARVMPATVSGVRVAGNPQRKIQRVALLGGAGDSLLDHPKVLNADVYLTSDLRHHPAGETIETSLANSGPALIDVAHWASESLWLEHAANLLSKRMPNVNFHVSKINTDPWNFAIEQHLTVNK